MPKPVFERNPLDHTKTSFLNWRFFENDNPSSFFTLGEGYIRSSIELIIHSIENNDDKRADIFIFPILHNFNHGIELYLKGLIWTLNILLINGKTREGSHNSKQLFSTLKSRLSCYKNGEYIKNFNKDFNSVKSYIDELYKLTNGNDKNDQMDFSRYPLNTQNIEHFYIISGQGIEIDLINFYERSCEIYHILEKTVDFLYWVELKNDNL